MASWSSRRPMPRCALPFVEMTFVSIGFGFDGLGAERQARAQAGVMNSSGWRSGAHRGRGLGLGRHGGRRRAIRGVELEGEGRRNVIGGCRSCSGVVAWEGWGGNGTKETAMP